MTVCDCMLVEISCGSNSMHTYSSYTDCDSKSCLLLRYFYQLLVYSMLHKDRTSVYSVTFNTSS